MKELNFKFDSFLSTIEQFVSLLEEVNGKKLIKDSKLNRSVFNFKMTIKVQ